MLLRRRWGSAQLAQSPLQREDSLPNLHRYITSTHIYMSAGPATVQLPQCHGLHHVLPSIKQCVQFRGNSTEIAEHSDLETSQHQSNFLSLPCDCAGAPQMVVADAPLLQAPVTAAPLAQPGLAASSSPPSEPGSCLLTAALAKEWDVAANIKLHPKLSLSTVTPGCNAKVAWWCTSGKRPDGCEHEHKWLCKVNNRSNGTGCPFCSGRRKCPCTSLAQQDFAAEWHPYKNGQLSVSQVAPNHDQPKVLHCILTQCAFDEGRLFCNSCFCARTCLVCSCCMLGMQTFIGLQTPQWHYQV